MGRKRGQSNEVLSMESVGANSRAVHTGRNNRGGVRVGENLRAGK